MLTTVERRRDKSPVTRKQERPSARTRAKISEALKGRTLSAETRTKISEARQGKKLSAEHKAKISAANKGRKSPMAGKKHSAETKAKMSAANKGKKLSAEHRAKLSAAKKGEKNPNYGKKGENHPNYGKKLSTETKAKMSAARKKEKHSKTIERARSAIARVAAGHTMKAASLEAGFGAGWLSSWKERHPEQYRLILDEEANKLKQKQTGLNAVRKSKKHPGRIKPKTNAISNNGKQSNSDKISYQPTGSDPDQKPEAPYQATDYPATG